MIIGNPPYNVGQLNENDNNKNRKYEVIDQRVSETYARTRRRRLRTQLVRPVRQVLPLGDGPACRDATGSSALSATTASSIRSPSTGCGSTCCRTSRESYHLDLHGNVRQNPKLCGTTYNVFGIQVGVGITIAVRSSSEHDQAAIVLSPRAGRLAQEEKLALADTQHGQRTSAWSGDGSRPTHDNTLACAGKRDDDFDAFMPIGSKEAKRRDAAAWTLFSSCIGVVCTLTADAAYLRLRPSTFGGAVTAFRRRLQRRGWTAGRAEGRRQTIDDFVTVRTDQVESDTAKRTSASGQCVQFR